MTWLVLVIFFQVTEGGGSPVTAQLMVSGEPTLTVTEPLGVIWILGVWWMVSEAVASTLPALFSARQMYSPSSSPVTLVILSTPPDSTSVLAVSGLRSVLVQVRTGLGMPATALHW